MFKKNPAGAFVLFLLSVAVIDQLSKFYILRLNALDPGALLSGIPIIIGFLEITLTYNQGIIFGFLGNANNLVILTLNIFILAGVFIFVAMDIKRGRTGLLYLGGFGLILGGALGNILDRIIVGKVIDFIKVYITSDFIWPIFNIADSAITVGIILVFADMIFFDRESKINAPDTS